jgi:hypothetical protein
VAGSNGAEFEYQLDKAPVLEPFEAVGLELQHEVHLSQSAGPVGLLGLVGKFHGLAELQEESEAQGKSSSPIVHERTIPSRSNFSLHPIHKLYISDRAMLHRTWRRNVTCHGRG